jgi:hypothetical protein
LIFIIYITKRIKKSSMSEYILSEDLAVWFGKKKKPKGSKQPKGPWVDICRKDKDGKHPPCGRSDADKGAYPKCRAAGVGGKMSAAEKKSACAQKRRAEKKDTQTGKGQKPIMTSHKKKTKKESTEQLVNLVVEKFKVSSDEYQKLYEDETYLLVAPLTHNASCKYGANTKWCTTNRDSDEMFDEHIIGGVLVYLIIKDKGLSERLNNSKFGIYRGWGGEHGRSLVYDELNNEHLNGEQWLSNEFEKIDKEMDYYKLMRLYNQYYDFMDKPSKRTMKNLKESIKTVLSSYVNTKQNISEELQYHIDNNIPVSENIYRVGSEKYFEIIKEARKLRNEGHYFNEEDNEILDSDLGKFFIYEGERLPLDFPMINEAEYQGKKVELGKPKKGGSKKWYVYVRNPKTGKIVKVSYGSPVMTAKWNDPGARASFAARHQCEKKKDRTKAGYWACRAHKDFGNNVPGRYW